VPGTTGGAGNGAGASPDPALGPAYGSTFDHPLVANAEPATGIRDASAPTVRLRLTVNRRRHRVSLRWTGHDTGGSGLRSYGLQVKRPHGGWHTARAHTRHRSYALRTRRAGRYAFRVRAVDGSGNRSRWSLRRFTLRR
jgi:hypothetical protein